MRKKKEMKLGDRERHAVLDFKAKVLDAFPEAEVILFGSAARGEWLATSDLDVLIIVNGEASRQVEDLIYDLAYEVELENGVVLGVVVEPRSFWDSDLARAMPLHWNIDREGVKI